MPVSFLYRNCIGILINLNKSSKQYDIIIIKPCATIIIIVVVVIIVVIIIIAISNSFLFCDNFM